jgi:hypothetical protein
MYETELGLSATRLADIEDARSEQSACKLDGRIPPKVTRRLGTRDRVCWPSQYKIQHRGPPRMPEDLEELKGVRTTSVKKEG